VTEKLNMRAAMVLCVVGLSCGGCLQLEITVALHDDDAGATVTERLCFTRELLELDRRTPDGQKITRWLSRESAMERAKRMGEGVKLVNHRQTDKPDGGIESVAVFEIPNVEDLRIVNPLLHESSPGRAVRLTFSPVNRPGDWRHRRVWVNVVEAEGRRDEETEPQPVAPLDLQAYRDLQPVFVHLMRGLEIAVRLETPRPVFSGPVRGAGKGATAATFFSISDEDLDAAGNTFIKNEEAMLSALRLDPFDESILAHTRGFTVNRKLPVLRAGFYRPNSFLIEPTRYMEREYFGE
jgi:hypothetical protein